MLDNEANKTHNAYNPKVNDRRHALEKIVAFLIGHY